MAKAKTAGKGQTKTAPAKTKTTIKKKPPSKAKTIARMKAIGRLQATGKMQATDMKLVTWNMQGANSFDMARTLLGNDYICLQECGTPPQGWGFNLPPGAGNGFHSWTFATRVGRDPQNFHIAFYRWSSAGSEHPNYGKSLAVIFKSPMNTVNAMIVNDPSSDNNRPAVGIEVETDKWVFSMHSPSMGTNNAHYTIIVAHLNAIQNQLGPNVKWIVAGDINYEAGELNTNFPLCFGPYPTQMSGGKLDYCIAGLPLTGNCPTNVNWVRAGTPSDHIAQHFRLTW